MSLHDPNLTKPESSNCTCLNFFGTILGTSSRHKTKTLAPFRQC
jgi:hypothetical protein